MTISTLLSIEARIFAAVLLGILGASEPVRALVITDAPRYRERASCGGQPTILGADLFAPETVINNGIDCYSEAATGSSGAALTGPDFPLLSPPWARSILNTRGDAGGVTSASVNYEWGVGAALGGVPGAEIPVIVHAYLEVEFDGNADLIRDLTAGISVGGRGFTRSACTPLPCREYHVELVIPLTMIADGAVDSIALETFLLGGGDLLMRAVADPRIEIDPAFAFRDLYEIVLAPGIESPLPPEEPSVGVPEPATLALLAFGLAALGVGRRKRAD